MRTNFENKYLNIEKDVCKKLEADQWNNLGDCPHFFS
jgi:hypothetical protein